MSVYETLLSDLEKEQKENKALRAEVNNLKKQLLIGAVKYEKLRTSKTKNR